MKEIIDSHAPLRLRLRQVVSAWQHTIYTVLFPPEIFYPVSHSSLETLAQRRFITENSQQSNQIIFTLKNQL